MTGDLRIVEQWRLIIFFTLLCKLIVKGLVIRIRSYMDGWVESEQRGFVSGWTIADNLLLFREVKWYVYVL